MDNSMVLPSECFICKKTFDLSFASHKLNTVRHMKSHEKSKKRKIKDESSNITSDIKRRTDNNSTDIAIPTKLFKTYPINMSYPEDKEWEAFKESKSHKLQRSDSVHLIPIETFISGVKCFKLTDACSLQLQEFDDKVQLESLLFEFCHKNMND